MTLFATITGPTVQSNNHVSSIDKFRFPLGANVVVGRCSKSKNVPAGRIATVIEKFDPCHPKYKVRDIESKHVSKIAEKHLFPAASVAKKDKSALSAILMPSRSASPRPESRDQEYNEYRTSCGMSLRRPSFYQYLFVKGMALIDTTNGKSVTVLRRFGGDHFEDPLYLVLYELSKQRKRVRQSDLVPVIALRTIISQDNLVDTVDPSTSNDVETEVHGDHVEDAVIAQPFLEEDEESFPMFSPQSDFFEGDRDNESIFNSFGPFDIDEELPSYISHSFGAAAAWEKTRLVWSLLYSWRN